MLVGSHVGNALQELRSLKNIRSLPHGNPEQASCVANTRIADRLIAGLPLPGSSFLDVGAHIGSVFAAARRNDPTLKVVAIEADSAKAKALGRRFPHATILNCAVGETEGPATFYVDHDNPGYSSLGDRRADRTNVREVTVIVRRLDDLFADRWFDTVKVDVEGGELGVFLGGEALLRRSRATIMFESAGMGTNALGYSPEALWNWFDERGYAVCMPDRVGHDGPSLCRRTFLDAHFYPMRSVNFFAVHEERRIEIRDRARKILRIG